MNPNKRQKRTEMRQLCGKSFNFHCQELKVAMNTLRKEDTNESFRISQAWVNKKFRAALWHHIYLYISFWLRLLFAIFMKLASSCSLKNA